MSWELEPGADACARCQAMVGLYEEIPSRPHPNCHCQIVATYSGGDRCWYEFREVFSPLDLPPAELEEHTPPGVDPELEVADYVYFDIYVECCDGSMHHKTLVIVEMIDMDWSRAHELNLEAIEQACQELGENCPDCPGIV
jgi:hypothetical protein